LPDPAALAWRRIRTLIQDDDAAIRVRWREGWGRLVALAGVPALAGVGLAGGGVPETDDTGDVSYRYSVEGAKLTWRGQSDELHFLSRSQS
jgi:hypothetical protein